MPGHRNGGCILGNPETSTVLACNTHGTMNVRDGTHALLITVRSAVGVKPSRRARKGGVHMTLSLGPSNAVSTAVVPCVRCVLIPVSTANAPWNDCRGVAAATTSCWAKLVRCALR